MTESSGDDREFDSAPQIEDPDDYNQRRRLESIHKQRERVLEILATLEERKEQLGEGTAAQTLHNSTKAFLTDIQHLMRSQGGTQFYTEELGELTIHPPNTYVLRDAASQTTYSLNDDRLTLIGDEYPAPYRVAVRGILRSEESGPGYLDLPATVRNAWTVNARIRHKGQETLHGTASTHIPTRISESAFRLGNKFLNDAGIDARTGETDHNPNPV